MEELLRELELGRKKRKIACYVFIIAISILYATNFIIRAFVYHDGVALLLLDFLLPLGLVASIYSVDWYNNYSTRLIYTHLPKVKMLAICAPIVAALIACITYEPTKDTVDFVISIMAITSMYIAPYALRNVGHACIAIILQAVGFILLAAYLGNNAAAMVTIAFTALTLICSLPKLEWLNRNEEHVFAKVAVAIVTLFCAWLLLLLIDASGVLEALYISSLGRPGLGSSAFKNQHCTMVLFTANFVGPVATDYPGSTLFANRVLTFILAQGGWLAVIPVLLSLVLMIVSGIYLCQRSIAVHYYISVSFLAVITVQTIGYILMCAGWDKLLFPQLCPFLDGGYYANTLFLLMAVCILPVKRKDPSDYRYSEDEDEDED